MTPLDSAEKPVQIDLSLISKRLFPGQTLFTVVYSKNADHIGNKLQASVLADLRLGDQISMTEPSNSGKIIRMYVKSGKYFLEKESGNIYELTPDPTAQIQPPKDTQPDIEAVFVVPEGTDMRNLLEIQRALASRYNIVFPAKESDREVSIIQLARPE